jgi:hypothetical protein
LNVLPGFRRKGLATRLLDRAEEEISRRSSVAGIGVGLHPGYKQAQKLYVKRGYVPDGRGVTYRDRYVEEGASVVLDDDLVLHLTKRLTQQPVRDEASSGLIADSRASRFLYASRRSAKPRSSQIRSCESDGIIRG